MKIPYTAPAINITAFNCPFCHAYAKQLWAKVRLVVGSAANFEDRLNAAYCTQCHELSVWWNGTMLHPGDSTAPMPNLDMPEDVTCDYMEARDIVGKSPRGAAALLRLGIQKLCKALGQTGKDLNADIGKLVGNGLPTRIQQSLDIVRVIGNESVHPGELDMKDDVATATVLFELVNLIVENQITQPKEVEQLYSKLPTSKLAGIEQRDGSTATSP